MGNEQCLEELCSQNLPRSGASSSAVVKAFPAARAAQTLKIDDLRLAKFWLFYTPGPFFGELFFRPPGGPGRAAGKFF